MDSFFDYIIILVIIISILNSIFGKKKKQQQAKTEGDVKPTSEKQKHDAVDILEQMFGISSEKKEPKYYGEKDDNQQSWDPEAEFSDADPKSVTETPAKVPSNYEKLQSAEFTPLDSHKKIDLLHQEEAKIAKLSKRQQELIKKLKDPKSLRDYVLVSEILGKPKAFND